MRSHGRGGSKRPRVDPGSSRDASHAQSNYSAPLNHLSPDNYSEGTAGQAVIPGVSEARPIAARAPGVKPEHGISVRGPAGKVAIPPLRPPQAPESSQKLYKKGRIMHACDFCRKSKAGCSGEQPCSRCKNAGVPCVYGDGKRDKDRKRLSRLSKETTSLAQHQTEVAVALKRIRLDHDLSGDEIRAAIDDILAMTPLLSPENMDESSAVPTPGQSSEPMGTMGSGEEEVDAEVGSTGSLDAINVDTDRDETRATGHMGKSSAVAWAKRTAEACQQDDIVGKPPTDFILATYHTEDADIEEFDMSNLNPYEWPDPKLADGLVQSYFDQVHGLFPILDKTNFMYQYNNFKRGSKEITASERIWLATLNAILALMALHAYFTKSEFRGHYRDHLIYCARAKVLCGEQGLLYQDARISTVRTLGLLSLYFVAAGRLNRAWTLCGLAIRQTLTLGLHIRSEAKNLSDIEKEHRVRLWWSLYSLECSLNELTGRPSCIADHDISTPLPLNVDLDDLVPGLPLYKSESRLNSSESRPHSKERPAATYQMPVGSLQPSTYEFPVIELPLTPSTPFIYRVQLAIISHEIVTQLYCAATIKERWADVQQTIRRIDQRLLAWRDSLPPELDITFDTWPEPNWKDPHSVERIGLALLFNSTRMILFRPCLCRFEGRIVNQSDKSKDINQDTVEACIHSARRTIALLTWPLRSLERLYLIKPWWSTLHHLCEALSVLMLEMAYRSQHLPNEATYILEDAKKGVRWLSMMSEQSVSARKAWEIFDTLIRAVAPRIKWSVFDLPSTAPVPPGYSHRHSYAPAGSQQGLSLHTEQRRHAGAGLTESNLAQLDTYQSTHPQTHEPQPSSQWNIPQSQPLYPLTSTYPDQANYAALYEEAVANPLDQTTAFQLFSGIGYLRGHYDEPWNDMFNFSAAEDISQASTFPVGQMATSNGGMVSGVSDGNFTAPMFDPPYGGFIPANPAGNIGYGRGYEEPGGAGDPNELGTEKYLPPGSRY